MYRKTRHCHEFPWYFPLEFLIGFRSNIYRLTMRTRPGFQARGISSRLRRSRGLERIPSTSKPGLVTIGGL